MFDVTFELGEVATREFLFVVLDMLFDKWTVASVKLLEDLATIHCDIMEGIFVEGE